MSELAHPRWCAAPHCNADRPLLDGHTIGVHRSSPEMVAATVLFLTQAPTAPVPSVEVRRGDVVLVLPLLEAQSLAPAVDDLLHRAGVGL